MRTLSKRESSRSRRSYDDDRNSGQEFDNSMEDNFINEDYYYNDNGRGGGFGNRDYDSRNFWRNRDEGDPWERGYERYVPEMNYGRSEPSRNRTTGYGNNNSQSMRDFDRWRNESPDYRGYRGGDNAGYRGRSSDDYENDYDRENYYNPAGYDREDYRRNPGSGNYDRHARNEDGYRQYNSPRAGSRDYDYYESYPSYGQGAPYSDHEYGLIDKQEARGRRGIDNEDSYEWRRDDSQGRRRFTSNEFDRQRRPMIRNKRY
jgi:hypothetical protein